MARIICDSYSKGEKHIWGNDPNDEFNQKIVAVNHMYGWLYEKGILEKVSFELKDYDDTTFFAVDVRDLEPYRKEMEASQIEGATLAVRHIFDEEYSPCTYSGAIELGWTMMSYRDVDGCVGRSWECGLIKSLDTEDVYAVAKVWDEQGPKAAVKALFAQFDWDLTLPEQKRYQDALKYFKEKYDADLTGPNERELIYCYENGKDLLDFDFWTRYESLCNEKMTFDEYAAIDKEFDGDPHDIKESDLKTISELKAALSKFRASQTAEPSMDDQIAKNDFDLLMDTASKLQYKTICSVGNWSFDAHGAGSFVVSHKGEAVVTCENNQIIDAKWGSRIADIKVYDVLNHILQHVPNASLDAMTIRTDDSLALLGYDGPSHQIATVSGLEDIDYYRAWVTSKANETDPEKTDYVVYWDQGNTWCEVLAVFEGMTHDEFVTEMHTKYNEWLREESAMENEPAWNDSIEPATFVSVWDGGYCVETACKINRQTGEVFDIEVSEGASDFVEVLDKEFIRFSDGTEQTIARGRTGDGFWYSNDEMMDEKGLDDLLSDPDTAQLVSIARNNIFELATRSDLETRNNDSDDFFTTSVWSLKAALVDAYNLGREQALTQLAKKPPATLDSVIRNADARTAHQKGSVNRSDVER